jgi:hypothetical protein
MRNIINFLLRIAKSARGLTNHYLLVTVGLTGVYT